MNLFQFKKKHDIIFFQDATQRNIVPELNEPFRCLWTDCKSFNSDFPEAIKFYWHVLWHSEEYRDQRGIKGLPCLWRGCTSKPNTVSKVFFKYFFGVPHLATCIFLFFYNEPELGVGIILAWL